MKRPFQRFRVEFLPDHYQTANSSDVPHPAVHACHAGCRNIPPLPGLTPNGRRVVILRGVDKDIPTPNVAEAMKLMLMMGDIRLDAEEVGVAGDIYIMDASVATAQHFAKFTPTLVKKFLVAVQVREIAAERARVADFFSKNEIPHGCVFFCRALHGIAQ